MSDLDDLIPQTRSVTVGGKTVVVQVLRIRQYSDFTKATAKPWALIVTGEYLAAITEFPDEVIASICAATDLDPAFVRELDGHAFLQLASAVLELNLDFFARAVFPTARNLAQVVGRAMRTSGELSPDLSAPDTGTATSSATPLPN